ncbi:hypothetical protein MKY30_10555 [Oceanobacillus sp. FSL W8-0428]|uniref:hypothetical protein n=1 Tax=Oceanobacillus TaxID=182709 RepID=UPI0030D851E7
MKRKENIVIGILFLISGILITFFLNTVTMIIALLIIAATAVYDILKKPTIAKILFYIIVFGAFSVYIIFFI